MPTQTARSGYQQGVRRDEHYRCVNPECCCEIKISRDPFVGSPVRQNLRCCCGSAWKRWRKHLAIGAQTRTRRQASRASTKRAMMLLYTIAEDKTPRPEQPGPAPPEPEQPRPQPPQPEIPPGGPEEPYLPSPDPEPLPTPVPGPTDPAVPRPILHHQVGWLRRVMPLPGHKLRGGLLDSEFRRSNALRRVVLTYRWR